DKKKMINRLKRAEGQLRCIQKMIEEDLECIDIVTQLSAVLSSINSIMGMVIDHKVQDCITHPS
ncbi:metal-sensitive transcriptional regulator, partial [Streptococcus suis]